MKLSQNEFINFILESLESMNGISWGIMFGGYVIRRNDLPIGLVFDDELYFKVNSRTLSDYQDLNSEPFSYKKQSKTIKLSNWRAPAEVLEDNETFQIWAEKAYFVTEDAAQN